jgi:hypothetical protein
MQKEVKHMKTNLKIRVPIIFITILLVSSVLMSVSATANENKAADNNMAVPQFEEWAKPMNLSEYNGHKPQLKTESPSLEALEKANPDIIALSELEKNRFNSISRENVAFEYSFEPDNTVSVKIPMETTKLSKGEVGVKSNPDVRITEVTYSWYWTQDITFNNDVKIQNYGTSTASGKVLFWSLEDGYGYYRTFSNLAPNANTTVTVPFQAVSAYSSIGVKPIAIEVRVDPNDVSTHFAWMPVDGIEKYNNNAGHLCDPDGGINLATSDIYHFPFNEGYSIISEAAVAGDDTTTPYETAEKINFYVHDAMDYDYDMFLDRNYTASDLWIISHTSDSGHYIGVCDEYSTLFNAFNRALGIPSKQYYMNMTNSSGITHHEMAELWDGQEWIHSDPTWNSFDNPGVYVSQNWSNMHFWNHKNANDDLYLVDTSGDGLLHYKFDFEREYLGLLDKYNLL